MPRPLLPVGFHRADMNQLRSLCVDYFPQSRSRPRIMETLGRIVALVNQANIPASLWIDGAFVTETENPGGFDVTLVLTEEIYERLDDTQHELFQWFRTVSLADRYHCDNYAIVIDAGRPDGEIMQHYWLRQYGFDRAGLGHGVIELLLPSIAP